MAKSNTFFKNPLRGQTKKIKPYIPQYVLRGVEPEEVRSATVPEESVDQRRLTRHASVVSYDNPRVRPEPGLRREGFAAIPKGPAPLGSGPIPNIGNSTENNWATSEYLDEEVEDDLSDPRYIDNNDFHTYEDDQYEPPAKPVKKSPQRRQVEIQVEEQFESEPEPQVNKNYDYVLLVFGEVIRTGFQKQIEEELSALIYGEHELCRDNKITPDDIVVLKKVKIKIGVFIE